MTEPITVTRSGDSMPARLAASDTPRGSSETANTESLPSCSSCGGLAWGLLDEEPTLYLIAAGRALARLDYEDDPRIVYQQAEIRCVACGTQPDSAACSQIYRGFIERLTIAVPMVGEDELDATG